MPDEYGETIDELEARLGTVYKSPLRIVVPDGRVFHVYVIMPDGVNYFLLAQCLTIEAMVAVIESLTRRNSGGPLRFKVEISNV